MKIRLKGLTRHEGVRIEGVDVERARTGATKRYARLSRKKREWRDSDETLGGFPALPLPREEEA